MSTQPHSTTHAPTDNAQVENILELFYRWERERANEVFLRQPYGNTWRNYTWAEVGQQARRIANGLRALNLPPQSNIGIISKNCAHWIINDIAIGMSGHVSVPFYPNLNAEQLNHVLTHSQCKALFIGKLDLANWEAMQDGIPQDVLCISYPQYPGNATITNTAHTWDSWIEQYSPMRENYIPQAEDILTIVYTSGTTGNPKGVMYTWGANALGMHYTADFVQLSTENRYFSYLPLCHIAERAVVQWAGMASGGSISFAESLETFVQNLQDTAPTHFLAVPRIWKKFQSGVLNKMPQKRLNSLLMLPIISGLVKQKIQKGLGLHKAKVLYSGAAPIPASLIDWFKSIGIIIQEGYAMSENMAICSFNPANDVRIGTVGTALPGVELRIDPDTEEILMRAPWVMKGYYREPEMTRNTIEDGWLHTGDMGSIDADGYLRITGRVKDMFKTSKGKYIVPVPIENEFGKDDFIEQVCVAGLHTPQPVALVVLSEIGQKAEKHLVESRMSNLLEQINSSLMDYQKLKQILIVKEAWTPENGILTPTLKIKRNKIEERYGPWTEQVYERSERVVWE
ncbi:AMP-binding protein [Eisenibacter elegans]|uniref:AMP-binding protein n=1 Tax=Eisenibacter elegans TaxID=997 RepID=UPI000425F0FE|nr:AMP-binding protein [Eisenibacter elegans]